MLEGCGIFSSVCAPVAPEASKGVRSGQYQLLVVYAFGTWILASRLQGQGSQSTTGISY